MQSRSACLLAFREVSYILRREPDPVQANEHQPPSACFASKLDSAAEEPFAAALPPQGSKWVHSVICCYKMFQIEWTQDCSMCLLNPERWNTD